ncbi:hypothetical protein [Caballeronia sp. LZ043]|uniref:hypothetical protein n=1 Tax=Caballeronia sp. LZ043 TaxID=3038569 RepID=UPI00286599E0|nr:hypothetical protein [Caballeronia sp. LZ043]MDR5825854.1 hypothetical protein [Caballeronia sp. LZ043]
MDWLFGQLHGMFGNKLLDGFRSGHVVDGKDTGIENMKATWTEKIRANGMKLVDVKRGLAGAERLKWPPTWGEFIELCKPPINIDAAVYEAIDQMRARQHGKDVWSDPAIYWAAVKIGEYDVISQTFSQLKPRFEVMLKKVLEGEIHPVPPRVPALAAPGAAESTREFGRQRLDELNASAAFKNISKGGNINWALRIIEEERQTGKVPLNKLKIARDAIFNVTGKAA